MPCIPAVKAATAAESDAKIDTSGPPEHENSYPPPDVTTPDRLAFKSTRSNRSSDAHRDYDGFDCDEELLRAQLAVKARAWKKAAQMYANLDESMQPGGRIPASWLGPGCMREPRHQKRRYENAVAREKVLGYRNHHC